MNLESLDNGVYEYLSEAEIDEYEKASSDRRFEIQSEVKNWIKSNYDYDISEFDYFEN